VTFGHGIFWLPEDARSLFLTMPGVAAADFEFPGLL
jgi:hypothetical protein